MEEVRTDTMPHEVMMAVHRATGEEQWDFVCQVAKRVRLVEDRHTIIHGLLHHQQWEHAATVAKFGVSCDCRDTILLKAIEWGQWDCVLEVMQLGMSGKVRDQVFLKAAECGRWDCVKKIVEKGVSSEERNSISQDGIPGSNARFFARLLKFGVKQSFLYKLLSPSIDRSQIPFLVEAVQLCDDASLTDFILLPSIDLKQWELVFELVKLHKELALTDGQMQTACEAAGRDGQWNCVLFLVKNGVVPSEDLLLAMFASGSGVLEQLLALFPGKSMSTELKEKLIPAAVKAGSCAVLQDIIRRHGENVEDVNTAIAAAVRSQKADALHAIVGCSNKVCNLVKKFFTGKAHGKLDSAARDPKWICETLKEGGNVRMALDIAVGSRCFPLEFVKDVMTDEKIREEVKWAYMKKICKRSAHWFEDIGKRMCSKTLDPFCSRRLFLIATRHGLTSEALRFGDGVTTGDVKFAFNFTLSFLPCNKLASFVKELEKSYGSSDQELDFKFYSYIVKKAFREFLVDNTSVSKFVCCFDKYCRWQEADRSFIVSMFKRGCRAAVRLNNLECFLGSCKGLLLYCDLQVTLREHMKWFLCWSHSSDDVTLTNMQKIVKFAIRLAIRKELYTFVAKLCATVHGEQHSGYAITKAFKQKAWPLVGTLTQKKTSTDADSSSQRWPLRLGAAKQERAFVDCLKMYIDDSEALDTGAIVLEDWLHNSDSCRGLMFTEVEICGDWFRQHRDKTLAVAAWCCENSCENLALLLAVAQGLTELLERLLPEELSQLNLSLFIYSCRFLLEQQDFSPAVVLIKHLPLDILGPRMAAQLIFGNVCVIPSKLLTAKLKDAELYRWVTIVHVCCHEFDEAEKSLKLCLRQDMIDFVIDRAAAKRVWGFVGEYASEACDPDVLKRALLLAMSASEPETVKTLANLVDLTDTYTDIDTPGTYLSKACTMLDRYGWKLRTSQILQHLIGAGVSTFQREVEIDEDGMESCQYSYERCPMMTAVNSGKVALLKLFHRSALCSNRRLFALAELVYERNREAKLYALSDDEIMYGMVEDDVLEYVADAASNPLSLQDLSRAAVSHSVGCRPGRIQRIQALPVPEPVKDFLQFKDLFF